MSTSAYQDAGATTERFLKERGVKHLSVFFEWGEKLFRAPLMSYIRKGLGYQLEKLADLIPLYQLDRQQVTEKRRGIFMRWQVAPNRWLWGTATRTWGIRIVGPVEDPIKVGFPFYYSVHNRSGSSLQNGWAISLMQAKRVSVMAALDIPYGSEVTWREMKQLVREEHQAARDETALKAIEGKLKPGEEWTL